MPASTTAEELRGRIRQLLEVAVAAGVTPSAVCAVSLGGQALEPVAVGDAVRYGSDGTLLAPEERVPAGAEALYDLASVTKIFSALTCLVLADQGTLDLDAPVAETLASYRNGAERRTVTLRHLLTHTSGLPPVWPGWRGRPFPEAPPGIRDPLRRELLADLLSTGLEHPPGQSFAYSCVGYNTAMAVAETAADTPWPELVTSRVLEPLGIPDLTFTPDPERCAATEFCPELHRGTVRGCVHDESAFVLGGAAANAGLFGTAEGLLEFGERLRQGFSGLLPEGLAAQMWADQLPVVMGSAAGAARAQSGFGQGLGLRIGQASWMGRSSARARGHNGFTGTSLLTDRDRGITLVLLTNRVHPSRSASVANPLRAAVADAVFAAA